MLKQVDNFFSQVSRVMLYKLYVLNRYIARVIKRLTNEEMDYLYYQLDYYYTVIIIIRLLCEEEIS
jgi:hypothetical protein